MTKRGWAGIGLLVAGWLSASATSATEVRFFRQQSTADFVDGDFEGLALDAEGSLRLALHFEPLAGSEEPFVFSARAQGKGWLLATGNSGRILRVEPNGDVAPVWAAPEPEIFALWVDADGTAYAGSSPDGKVYVLGPDGGSEIFDPEETYIWAIARAPWGDLLVATGDSGKLYAIAPTGESRVLFESAEPHLRSLHPLADSVLIGTAGEGLILTVDATGKVRTLFDADQPEITAFADDGAGGWYAAAVAAEAALSQRAAESSGTSSGEGEEGAGEVSIEVSATSGNGGSGEHSTVVRGSGALARKVTGLKRETIYSLGWIDGRLWLGTGVEGNVYSFAEGRLTLEASLDDRQVVGLFGAARPVLVTTNAVAVYRAAAGAATTGSYVSKALDASTMSRFGSLRWLGEAVDRQAIRFAVRSGLSAEPDATWSQWSEPAAGDELDLRAVPPGRFVQWRAEIDPAAGDAARVSSVQLSYRQSNAEPVVTKLEAMDPGQVLVPAAFNPGDQIYEPAHPDRAGIFSTLEPAPNGNGGRLKPLWRHGFQTLRWEAEDPNEDELRFTLGVRREGSGAGYIEMADDIEEPYYSFDATVLPDGVYRFRLEASDRLSNDAQTQLSVEQVSAPVVIDHTPPRLLSVGDERGKLSVLVEDTLSPIRSAEVSIDGGAWEDVPTADALLDGQSETLLLSPPAAARLVLLRVMDGAFNTATYDLLEKRR